MRKLWDIFFRYFLILILGLGNLYIIYKIFTPLTVYSVASILSLFSNVNVFGNIIFLGKTAIEIIPPCVAGSAYYLLFILNFSTRSINYQQRLKILVFTFTSLFMLNIIRIVFLISITDLNSFETIHWLFYQFVSVIFIVGIWLFSIKIYKIKGIPFFSDIIEVSKLMKKTQEKQEG